jgi:DNA topoisomerase-2
MLLVDADMDGSHIKGLCVNLFHSEWASLFRLNGFISFMNTPILRAKKGAQSQLFYHEGEYETWKQGFPEGQPQGWTIKYFKGLGTSTAVEFKEYFTNKRIVDFTYHSTTSDDVVDKIFNKKRADERKTWLEQFDKKSRLNTTESNVSYDHFVDKELIHFSVYDCERSIPNLVDGLKTSLRKILYCAFKRKLTTEVKVAQFSGYVSEHSEYHHGEASLNGAIIGLAQNFVGSNNINLLMPNGQFGTRLNSDDSASERYIFTQLNPLTRCLFPELDDPILHYLNEDGTSIEPEYYVPILPMVLVNGISGIGTGFSSSIPSFHPMKLVEYLRNRLNTRISSDTDDFVPYYENFRGTVNRVEGETQKFLIKGVYERTSVADQIRITELPVGTWTMPYITVLENLADGGVDKQGKRVAPSIKDFVSNSTEKIVDIVITFTKGRLAELEAMSGGQPGVNGLEKLLKLATTMSTTNMHLFDDQCKLKKYNHVHEIIDAFSLVRLATYTKRKIHQMNVLEKILVKLSNKVRYIECVLKGTVDLRRKTATEIETMLNQVGLNHVEDSYDYLIKMPMISVSVEQVEKLQKEHANTLAELTELRNTTEEQMWLRELSTFETQYQLYVSKRAQEYVSVTSTGTSSTKKKPAGKK